MKMNNFRLDLHIEFLDKKSMIIFALKILIGNPTKYYLLIAAITFSTLLMAQQSAIFFGFMRLTTATIRNVSASVWVVDPSVEQVGIIKAMRDIELERVRSIEGVKWASPYYQQIQEVSIANGTLTPVYLIGVDQSTLAGIPKNVTEGNIYDIWQSNAVIIDTEALKILSKNSDRPLSVGSIFELNDKEARVVAVVKAELGINVYPLIITTYQRALEYAPKVRKTLGYIILEPEAGVDPIALTNKIKTETGLKAITSDQFSLDTVKWYFKHTAIPFSFSITIGLGFIVGLAVAGQTFYMFIAENLPKLSALKAMGASNSLIFKMLLIQACLVGFMGFGCGIGLSSLFGLSVIKSGSPPYYLPNIAMFGIGLLVLLICLFSAYMGLRKVRTIDISQVFHG